MGRRFGTAGMLLGALAALGGCGQGGAGSSAASTSASVARPAGSVPDDAVAIVNGKVLTERDVALRIKGDSHSKVEDTPENRKQVLENVIALELAAQRASELGLDADPGYQAGLQQLQAQLDAYRRAELAPKLYRDEVRRNAAPTEAEARAYFDRNLARIRRRVHVLQILRRNLGAIEDARRQLEGGKPFAEVAESLQPDVPGRKKPWDVGFLRWNQVPEPWRAVLDTLEPGGVSGVIKGPNERYWLIELVAVEEDPDMDFETAKPIIVDALTNTRTQELRARTEEELRARAHIESLTPTNKPPPPEE
ncbi:MAG: peptidyl-prolyl cis-trans isomerase [Polyangiaceae bacterium]|nr:peptidyl-prolyl cis-trans isomerase [Polyangiaceae bacterium]